ncbi:MAG: hypothetical protein K2M88_04265, partial [Muribaculaceae bacterium]|nr:hypothetical protein [Muribaculaceae bacterium]
VGTHEPCVPTLTERGWENIGGEGMGVGMQFLGGLGVICLGGIAIGGSFSILGSILWSIF